MTGEMSAAEVTSENFPGLFELADGLAAAGIEAHPRPFDQYLGPYLYVPQVGKLWYDSEAAGEMFLLDTGTHGISTFETRGADFVRPATPGTLRHGVYTIPQAIARIRQLLRKR